ncbi:MAG: ankyrin repeat domain-containing protein [Candidatus Thiodiazotropha lotti]|nr:ankyrin repeat domain-containing protein [Candidatus Thiodiazotropha lotti]
MKLTEIEYLELKDIFQDVPNYESEDPLEPIDPLVYEAPDGDTCMHIAARRGDVRAMELLVKAGLDVNSIGDIGCTPLHYAVSSRNQNAIKFLLDHGASTAIKNELGLFPLDNND